MSMCVYSVSVVLCVGSGLATGLSPVHGVLPTVYGLRNRKSDQGPQGL
jgi:formate hydrogenlyase subunit 3/multisubunit Na+/H+ antiporter MnhD subunit